MRYQKEKYEKGVNLNDPEGGGGGGGNAGNAPHDGGLNIDVLRMHSWL